MHVARVIYQLLNGYMDWRCSAFFLACCHGHILVAQWLYGLGGIDIYAVDDRAFRFACNGGHLSVAHWLYGLRGIAIHSSNDIAFRWACEEGLMSVA